jgi:hypothetical protein
MKLTKPFKQKLNENLIISIMDDMADVLDKYINKSSEQEVIREYFIALIRCAEAIREEYEPHPNRELN